MRAGFNLPEPDGPAAAGRASDSAGGGKLAAALLPPDPLATVVNTADDFVHLGLRIAPTSTPFSTPSPISTIRCAAGASPARAFASAIEEPGCGVKVCNTMMWTTADKIRLARDTFAFVDVLAAAPAEAVP